MYMEQIRFTATRLAGTGKRGKLLPDKDGYYIMPVAGLNVYNSRGEYYTAEGAKQLFEESSIFMRRVANGCVKGELGHPKRLPGMSTDDYLNRLMTIEETNVCCHFAEFWLDLEFGKNNPKFNNPELIAVMAKIKPAGPHGPQLKESMETGGENVCFSLRGLTRDYYQRGKTYRVLESLLTIDQVVEGGLQLASKFSSPVLESIEECVVRLSALEKLAKSTDSIVTTEDTKALAIEAFNKLSIPIVKDTKVIPAITNW
jgi:Peptidase S80 family